MSDARQALMSWDFLHSKKRPKVYIDNRWQHECHCGATFPTMQEWENHRFDEGVRLFDVRVRPRLPLHPI